MEQQPDIAILYGSQTGNAEDLARRIGYKAKSLGFSTLVEPMDDFPLKLLPKQRLVIFVCSTTGHGQEPENMKNLYNFIRRRDLPKDCLSSLKYIVYGLGDSSYAKFNYVSKVLFRRLEECGAKSLQKLITGNEQHHLGCDGAIYLALDDLWAWLGKTSSDMGDEQAADMLGQIFPESSYEVCMSFEPSTISAASDGIFEEKFRIRYNLKAANCILNRRVTPESHFQDTRHLCFKSGESLDYQPGDVCTILPANTDENTNKFIELLGLEPDQRFSLKKRDPNYMVNYLYDFIPEGLRVYDVIKYYFDIQSVPKRSFFEFIWPFSQNHMERDKLKEFSATEGQEEMYEYCVQPKRSILEVLQDFPETVCNIKFQYLFDIIPPIKPRSFSIASSVRVHPNEVHLIVGVVKYQTRLKRTRIGLCSNYLASLTPVDADTATNEKSSIKFFIKRTDFKLPEDDQTPIIMIGPGLGIAPFRSFIEERAARNTDKRLNFMYFGCRFKSSDYYFKEELESYQERDIITLRVAVSREDPKCYVQDLLREDSELIRRLIVDEKATVYVAGNSKLPEDLRTVFKEILGSEKIVAQFETTGRIQYDCW